MIPFNKTMPKWLLYCAAFLLLICCAICLMLLIDDGAVRAEIPTTFPGWTPYQRQVSDLEAKELARVARARADHNEDALIALADEYRARWKRGERGIHILASLEKLVTAVRTWEWEDFRKQSELPRELAIFVLENAPAATPLDMQWRMALGVCDTHDQHAPSFTAAERKRRASLAAQVLQRILAQVDPAVDLSARVSLNVSPPDGVPHGIPGMSPKAIRDPALRAEYERRIRENALLARRQGEQGALVDMKKMLLLLFDRYVTSVYSSHPEAGPELEKILTDIKTAARGNSPDVDATLERVTREVKASYSATTRPQR